MSMNSTGISQSPPSVSRLDSRNGSKSGSDFQFDFSKFGEITTAQHIDNSPMRASVGPTLSSVVSNVQPPRQNSLGRYQPSPKTQSQSSSRAQAPASHHSSRSGSMNAGSNMPAIDGFNSTLPQMSSNLFTPSILNSAGTTDYGFVNTASPQHIDNGGDSNSGISRAFRFNSGSGSSNTDSPSVSSLSQFNPNSSCGTSPESAHDSPPADINKQNTATNPYVFGSNLTHQNSLSNVGTTAVKNNNSGCNNHNSNEVNFDWLASQNGGTFDPVLFGDYRDSQDAVLGDGDFNNGFFNDAFPFDFGSPNLNFNFSSPKPQQQAPTSASRNLLAEVEKAREGDDDASESAARKLSQENKVPLAQAEEMLNCNTIWYASLLLLNQPKTNGSTRSQLQSNPDFKDGKFDLDGLCSELRAKAKCSESGVTVPSGEVDAAFRKLGATPSLEKPVGPAEKPNAHYVFERDSVDEALRRLGGGI